MRTLVSQWFLQVGLSMRDILLDYTQQTHDVDTTPLFSWFKVPTSGTN